MLKVKYAGIDLGCPRYLEVNVETKATIEVYVRSIHLNLPKEGPLEIVRIQDYDKVEFSGYVQLTRLQCAMSEDAERTELKFAQL